MAQVTIYLDARTAARLRKAAREARKSQSRWLADLIRHRTATEWPDSFRRLAGAWADAPTAGDLRQDVPKDLGPAGQGVGRPDADSYASG